VQHVHDAGDLNRVDRALRVPVKTGDDLQNLATAQALKWLCRSQIHSTNPIERLNREIKRRTNVVSIFPNEAAIVRLVGAILLEQNDEWAVSRRYMTLEALAGLCDDPTIKAKAITAA
jgi:transposase-like protein